jgi:hypothetical protein
LAPSPKQPPPRAAAPESRAPAEPPAEPSYVKLAFANPYNLSLLAGGLAASAITLNPIPAVVALGLEGLWLLHGPDNPVLRRLYWDPRREAARREREDYERQRRLRTLGAAERERVASLVERRAQIAVLAGQNPSFTGELLRAELLKADRLVDAFIDLSLTRSRYQDYLEHIDARELQRDCDRYDAAVRAGAPGDPQTALSVKNLEIVRKRQERVQEIGRSLGVVQGQLDLIENSFQLIADQIVTMQSPQQLSGQLDELLTGVDSIRETARDTADLTGP